MNELHSHLTPKSIASSYLDYNIVVLTYTGNNENKTYLHMKYNSCSKGIFFFNLGSDAYEEKGLIHYK
jgi:hypothetical protein